MAIRDKWQFNYAATELAAASLDKAQHHRGRLEWWQAQRKQVMDTIRSDGIEIDESLIADMMGGGAPQVAASWSNSNYRGPTVNVRNDLLRDLNECMQKVREHETKVIAYDGWYQVLNAQTHTSVPCNHDDWLFFFGKGVIEEQ